MAARKAFTLMELMVVVAIIGILAAVAIPRFAGLINKSKEGGTRAALNAVRSSLDIYYANNTFYPTDDLSSLTAGGHYINDLPIVKLPGTNHPENRHVSLGDSPAAAVTDTGGWAYVNDPASPDYGRLLVNCTHTDSNGAAWDGQ